MKEITASNAQTADQNILLQAQLSATVPTSSNGDEFKQQINSLELKISTLQANEERNQSKLDTISYENTKLLEELDGSKKEWNHSEFLMKAEIDKLKKDQEDLLELLTDQVNDY